MKAPDHPLSLNSSNRLQESPPASNATTAESLTHPCAFRPTDAAAVQECKPPLGAVTIFGMGYVGCVSAACLANNGFEVSGVDVDPNKVELINSGQSPITEPGLDELLAKLVGDKFLSARTRANRLGDVSLVCVGTPSNENGSLDLRQVLRVCEEIGFLLKGTDSYHVVNLRSTVVPGTVEGTLIPLLEEKSGKRAGRDFGVCMNPEFLRESTAVKDFYNPPFTVIGALDQRSGQSVARLYGGVQAPVEVVPIRVAEMIKYACNSFHALKVSFANEIGNVCKSLGIDSWQVMNVFCKDTKLNLSPYYLKPGFAFGGSCLPKDLRAIVHLARQHDLELPLLGAALASNELQIDRAYKMIKHTGKSKVGVLGLSFKVGSDDLRESPTVALIERLIGKGYSVSIYDDDVSLPEIRGKNRQFIEKTLPHISSLMKSSLREVFENSEVITVCKKRAEYEAAAAALKESQVVVDLVRIFDGRSPLPSTYEGICW
jgi:GDP-mannose 6-dehydrogenase